MSSWAVDGSPSPEAGAANGGVHDKVEALASLPGPGTNLLVRLCPARRRDRRGVDRRGKAVHLPEWDEQKGEPKTASRYEHRRGWCCTSKAPPQAVFVVHSASTLPRTRARTLACARCVATSARLDPARLCIKYSRGDAHLRRGRHLWAIPSASLT